MVSSDIHPVPQHMSASYAREHTDIHGSMYRKTNESLHAVLIPDMEHMKHLTFS